VADQLTDGRRFRALTIVDVFTRESLAIEVGQALKGTDVVEVSNRLRFERSAPKVLFCDNGSEFTSQITRRRGPLAGSRWDATLAWKQYTRERSSIIEARTAQVHLLALGTH